MSFRKKGHRFSASSRVSSSNESPRTWMSRRPGVVESGSRRNPNRRRSNSYRLKKRRSFQRATSRPKARSPHVNFDLGNAGSSDFNLANVAKISPLDNDGWAHWKAATLRAVDGEAALGQGIRRHTTAQLKRSILRAGDNLLEGFALGHGMNQVAVTANAAAPITQDPT